MAIYLCAQIFSGTGQNYVIIYEKRSPANAPEKAHTGLYKVICMLQEKLLELLDGLEALQEEQADGSAKQKDEEEDPIDRELTAVMDLDRSCRASLEPIEAIISRVDMPRSTGLLFIKLASDVLVEMDSLSTNPAAYEAYSTLDELVHSGRKFSLHEMFAIISAIIALVSVSIDRMDDERRGRIIRALDRLLGVKLKQLKLLNILVVGEDSSSWLS